MSIHSHSLLAETDARDADGSPAARAAISAYWTQVYGCPEDFGAPPAAPRRGSRGAAIERAARAYRLRRVRERNTVLQRILHFLPDVVHGLVSPEHASRSSDLPSLAVVPVAEVNDAAKRALDTAFATADKVIAVHVCDRRRPSATRRFEQQWLNWNPRISMVLLDGREYDVATPILGYVQRAHPRTMVVIVITHDRHIDISDGGITHHHANQLENAFRREPNTVICRAHHAGLNPSTGYPADANSLPE